mmetsp:Transcript_43225/g.108225  ORF Transcript_43225/g.108225 Transcript_43225/m.108225 type:complete len:256 (-) Transcript_43225:1244-2011(-)
MGLMSIGDPAGLALSRDWLRGVPHRALSEVIRGDPSPLLLALKRLRRVAGGDFGFGLRGGGRPLVAAPFCTYSSLIAVSCDMYVSCSICEFSLPPDALVWLLRRLPHPAAGGGDELPSFLVLSLRETLTSLPDAMSLGGLLAWGLREWSGLLLPACFALAPASIGFLSELDTPSSASDLAMLSDTCLISSTEAPGSHSAAFAPLPSSCPAWGGEHAGSPLAMRFFCSSRVSRATSALIPSMSSTWDFRRCFGLSA